MSIFDFPRINFKGTLQLNPGTANNDDNAPASTFTKDWGSFAGHPLALIDSKKVEARTYGMSDEVFIEWIQKIQTFDGQVTQVIPAEWNYYGGMDSKTLPSTTVIGVQTGPGKGEVYNKEKTGVALTEVLGADLSFTGSITDINSQGSPPATQFFISEVTLKKDGKTLFSGQPSKGVGQWLNFYRNVNKPRDAGAGAYVYHVILGETCNLPGFDGTNVADRKVVGVVFRYYLYRAHFPGDTNPSNEDIVKIYKRKNVTDRTNPKNLEIIGTIAPLYEDEDITAAPVGRLMISNTPKIPTPPGSSNNGTKGLIALAPAVLHCQDKLISVDFVGTFPDNYQGLGSNAKFDFGPVRLVLTNGTKTVVIDPVDYADTAAGDERGWVFDFDISKKPAVQKFLKKSNFGFMLVQTLLGEVLGETDYYFVTNQQAIYAEQFGSGKKFVSQGSEEESARVWMYRRGEKMEPDSAPPVTVWQYRSIPLEAPGDAVAIHPNYKPGQAIEVDTRHPGNFLFTFTVNDAPPEGYPPTSYLAFQNPPYVTNSPQISLRILPNEDFSEYYSDPNADPPVANDHLTFEVVYEKVLRVYYLLYPAMNARFPLNSKCDVIKHAQAILDRTEKSLWPFVGYMPRTRDLSESQRQLLRSWCTKVKGSPCEE